MVINRSLHKMFKSKEMQNCRLIRRYMHFLFTQVYFYLVTISNQYFCNVRYDKLKKHIILRTAPLFVDLYPKLNL